MSDKIIFNQIRRKSLPFYTRFNIENKERLYEQQIENSNTNSKFINNRKNKGNINLFNTSEETTSTDNHDNRESNIYRAKSEFFKSIKHNSVTTELLLVGAGGTGSNFLYNFIRYSKHKASDINITIVDPDIIEQSNLIRQPLYDIQDINKSKAYIAAEKAIEFGWNAKGKQSPIQAEFGEYNIVICAVDNDEARRACNEKYRFCDLIIDCGAEAHAAHVRWYRGGYGCLECWMEPETERIGYCARLKTINSSFEAIAHSLLDRWNDVGPGVKFDHENKDHIMDLFIDSQTVAKAASIDLPTLQDVEDYCNKITHTEPYVLYLVGIEIVRLLNDWTNSWNYAYILTKPSLKICRAYITESKKCSVCSFEN